MRMKKRAKEVGFKGLFKGLPFFMVFVVFALPAGMEGCESDFEGFSGGGADVIGLDMEFLRNVPPRELESDVEFQVGMKVVNYGEASSGRVCVEDTVDDYYGGIPQDCAEFSIRGARIFDKRVEPEEETLVFPGVNSYYFYRKIPPQRGSFVARMMYDYRTLVEESLCIKDPLRETAVSCGVERVLRPDVKAPLKVERIEKSLFRIGDGQVKLRVDIHLRNVGGELSLGSGKNKILMESASFGPYALECDVEGGVVEIVDEEVVKCSRVLGIGGEVEQHPLVLSFRYNVEVVKTLPFEIVE